MKRIGVRFCNVISQSIFAYLEHSNFNSIEEIVLKELHLKKFSSGPELLYNLSPM